MKKYILILLTGIFIPLTSKALEVSFPEVAGVKVGESMGPAEWIRYIFLLAQAMVGLAIIYTLTKAGFLWMTGGDKPGNISEAKDRALGAVLGLVILLGSYLFLQTINPQLVNIKNPSIDFGTDAPSGMLDFWNKLFFKKHGVGETCGSSFDCRDLLECVKSNPKQNSGVCTETGGLFGGYQEGHACQKDNDCGTDLTCDDSTKVCIAGTKSLSGSACGPGNQCPGGQRCFKTSSGELADNVPGECSSYKAIGEECRTNIADECRGSGVRCKITDAPNHKGVCTKE